MTVAERRIEVHAAIWRGLSVQQAARTLGLPVRTVAADVRIMRRNGVVMPPPAQARSIEGVEGVE